MAFTSLIHFSNLSRLKRTLVLAVAVLFVAAGAAAFVPGRAQAAACTAPSTDYGSATSTVKIDNAATYKIWSRMFAPDTTGNSYLLEVDGNNCYVVGDNGVTTKFWSWVDWQNGNTSDKIMQNMTVGNHTIKLIGREAGVKLGRVLFVSDTNCVPVDNGSNCTVAGDTTPPAVTINAPDTNATVSGALDITASATDNVGVTKVEFYINGALAATDVSNPYSYNWNTASVANGPVSLMTKAYDAAGNVTSDSRQITVANGDKQAPTTPTNPTATANAYNKVTVKWTASTDNVGVTGYRVSRNGATLGDVTSGTQYVDSSVLPSTSYDYQVLAYDAASNKSGLSTVATVKTPAASNVDTQAPSVPTDVTAKAAGKNQINVSWKASTDNVGVVAYDVYRTTGTITAAKVATVTTTSYGDTGLSANTQYSYYIIARDNAGNASGKSASASVKTESDTKVTTGTLKGKVTFSKRAWWNRPLIQVQVDGHRRIHSTKSDGSYNIEKLPAGTYRVKYGAFGARTQTVVVKIEAGKVVTQDITLRAK